MSQCCFAGCSNEGTAAPRAVLVYSDGVREWEVPMILSLQVCESCRERVTVERHISKDLIESVAAMRPGTSLVSHTLEWVPFTHPEYVAMKRAMPN